MTDLCAIQGQLVDVRNVFTDKCVKLTIHVSAERAMEVMTAFGWPTNVSPVPVAIARLNSDQKGGDANSLGPECSPETGQHKTMPALDPDPPVRAPRKWEQITPAQQAGIRCNEPAFIRFLNEHYDLRGEDKICSTAGAEQFVRTYCAVESRRDIREGTEPATLWSVIDGSYRAWQLAPGVGAA